VRRGFSAAPQLRVVPHAGKRVGHRTREYCVPMDVECTRTPSQWPCSWHSLPHILPAHVHERDVRRQLGVRQRRRSSASPVLNIFEARLHPVSQQHVDRGRGPSSWGPRRGRGPQRVILRQRVFQGSTKPRRRYRAGDESQSTG